MSYFLTRRVAKTEDGIDDLKLSINTTNALVSVINGNITSLNASVGSLQGSVASTNANVVVVRGNITSLTASVGLLQGNITAINSTMNTVVKSITSQSPAITVSNNGNGVYSLASSLRLANQSPTVEGFGIYPVWDPQKYLYSSDFYNDNAWRVNLTDLDFDSYEYAITLDIQTKTSPVDTHLRWCWDGDWATDNLQYRQNWLDYDNVNPIASGDVFSNKLIYLRAYAHLQHHLKMNLRQPKHDASSSYYPRIILQCDCVQTSLNPSNTAHQRALYTSRSFSEYTSSTSATFTGNHAIRFYIDTGNASTTDNYCSNNSAWVRVVKIPI